MLPFLVARQARPVLGICLGMQLLAEGSEEAPKSDGLGFLPGIVRRLGPGVKVPHMGWCEVTRQGDPAAIPDLGELWLYFVHTYALEARSETALVARHGRAFAAAEVRGQVIGFQPHPEKSGAKGQQLLGAALQWMGETPTPKANA
jgi:imidazole glycerol phosphate synthase glutamine amidotransferase subunit